ncbi:hypothetical protein AADZ91_08800 [Colwelliaceae bacterium 6441]
MNITGLGDPNATLSVYIENIPPLVQYQTLQTCQPMQKGEIQFIAEQTGNHWRKIFNVYAKFIYQLMSPKFTSWQQFRDEQLLQTGSQQNLLFNLPATMIINNFSSKKISIVMGKSYATKLGLAQHCQWLSPSFAINTEHKLIICPYFDYRQLSNKKITELCQLIRSLD